MTWFPIEPEDAESAMMFARETVDITHDRMGYGSTPGNLEARRFHIYVGKVAEQITFRYLREQLNLDIIESTHQTGGPDQYDFRIDHGGEQVTGDIKSFHIFRRYRGQERTTEEAERRCWALIPVDQYQGRPKNFYVFAIILCTGQFASIDPGLCLIRWATYSDVSSWSSLPKGRRVFPYNATRTDNYGLEISQCRKIEDLPAHL